MNRRLLAGIGLGSILFAACAGDHRHATGGGTVQPGTQFSGLYVANGDDSITRVDLDNKKISQIHVGKEPARVAQIGSRVYVSLRNERAVMVYDETGAGLRAVFRIQTGAEPYGVAATETRIYVAASVSGLVTEYDAKTFQPQRAWEIAGEPRWVTLHPSHEALYVGSAYGGLLTYIDLRDGSQHEVALPVVKATSFSSGMQQQFTFTRRITGDVAAAPDGQHIYVPMLYVDNTTVIADNTGGQCNRGVAPMGMGGSTSGTSGAPTQPPPPHMGGCGGYDQQKFNPVVTGVTVDPSGAPSPTRQPEAILVSSFLPQSSQAVAGYPAALAITEDSRVILAAIEGAQAVLAINVNPSSSRGGAPNPGGGFAQGANFVRDRQIIAIAAGAGPRGIGIINGSRAYVHAGFDRELQGINLDDVRNALGLAQSGGSSTPAGMSSMNPSGLAPPSQPPSRGVPQLSVNSHMLMTTTRLAEDVEEGRKLFFATNNPVMATVGAGVSCGTCHFDGRTDGLTWHFQRGPRQTPMLAADLEHAMPVGWAGNVQTVADEGFNTSQQLMGGRGIQPWQVHAIQTFLFQNRAVDTPMKGSTDSRVQHGLQVFAAVGCMSCHNGPAWTNNQTYSLLGLAQVKTRPLTSIAASAPYFHDGSAATLSDVIDRASKGEMGQPFSISDSEKADLVLFLQSL